MKRIQLYFWLYLIVPLNATSGEINFLQAIPAKEPPYIGQQLQDGINLCFDEINKSGGVYGSNLKLITIDRGSDPKTSVAIVRDAIRKFHPVALLGMMGTSSMEAVQQSGLLSETLTPVIGVRSGSVALRNKINPWIFHTRPDYRKEAIYVAEHLRSIGYKRLFVFYENSEFGREALSHLNTATDDEKLSIIDGYGYESRDWDFLNVPKKLSRSNVDAIVAIGESKRISEFYKVIAAARLVRPIILFSTADSNEVVRYLGAKSARGISVVLTVPKVDGLQTEIQRRFANALKNAPNKIGQPTQGNIEGYIYGNLAVKAVTVSVKPISGESMRDAMERLHVVDFGGVMFSYSSTNHNGADYFDIGIIGENGKLLK